MINIAPGSPRDLLPITNNADSQSLKLGNLRSEGGKQIPSKPQIFCFLYFIDGKVELNEWMRKSKKLMEIPSRKDLESAEFEANDSLGDQCAAREG